MKLAIGSDHAGYVLKEKVKEALRNAGHEVEDYGCNSTDSIDYPDFGYAVAHAVADGTCERGVLICMTGVGMSMVANKVKGIRAALCHDLLTAQMSRQHNNANVLTMGSHCVSAALALEIVKTWMEAQFEGGRHQRRIDKIMSGQEC